MYEKFNPNFQNTLSPQQLNGINTYGDQYFGEYDRTPYVQALNPPLPGMSTVGTTSMAQTPYPLQSSLATPTLSTPVNAVTPSGYAKGGEIKEKKRRKKEEHVNPYPSLAEMIRQQGQEGDTILAHINPIEAMILKQMGGSGTINPVTGLPEFFFPLIPALIGAGKALFATTAGKALMGAGIGALTSKLTGHSALKGAAIGGLGGILLPALGATLGGRAGASGLGAAVSPAAKPGLASLLFSNSGADAGLSGSSIARLLNAPKAGAIKAIGGATPEALEGLGSIGAKAATATPSTFFGMLGEKSKDFFSSPENLLVGGLLATQLAGRKSLKQQKKEEAEAQKEYNRIMKGTEAEQLAEAQAQRRIERNKFLPEERLGNLEGLMLHRKEHTPEEQARTGRWFSYYNNPAFMGVPVPYKTGGPVEYVRERYEGPEGLGHFLQGATGGQDDKIPAMLSDGEYIIDATTVANLGDGNNEAGAKKLDMMVRNIRKHKGGSTKLPPKAKKINTYMRKK